MNHTIIFFVCLLCPFIITAQKQPFVLKGTIGHLPPEARIYISYANPDKKITDTIIPAGGVFTYAGNVNEPVEASLFLSFDGNPAVKRNSDITTIYLEKGTIELNSKDSMCNASVSGTINNTANENLKHTLAPVSGAIRQMLNARLPLEKRTKEYSAQLRRLSDSLEKNRISVFKKFILEHPTTMVALDAIKELALPVINYEETSALFKTLSARVKHTQQGRVFDHLLQIINNTEIDATAPDFTGKNQVGKIISLSSFKGKYVLLDFWATWCTPCRAETPFLVKTYNAFKDKGFVILSVSMDSKGSENLWESVIRNDRMDWFHICDFNGFINQAAELYGISAIPQNFLINPEGKIVAKNLRGIQLEQKIAELLSVQRQ